MGYTHAANMTRDALRLAVLLLCSVLTIGQRPSAGSLPNVGHPSEASQSPQGTDAAQVPNQGCGEVLSDTLGVDFGPYLKGVCSDVQQSWYQLIPESSMTKKANLAIEFAITKEGKIADMRLVASSGDVRLDRAAWGGIANSNPFPPLPSEFTGTYLALRLRFYYNGDPNGFKNSGHGAAQPVTRQPTDRTSAAQVAGDAPGPDYAVYAQTVVQEVRKNWNGLIPQTEKSKESDLAIEFSIEKDGKLSNMSVVVSSGDEMLDHTAWRGIIASSPFPPLPGNFNRPYLSLRMHFHHSKETGDAAVATNAAKNGIANNEISATLLSTLGAEVSISPFGDLEVPAGGTAVLVATVKGALDKTVTWTITGTGCARSACGKMDKDTYRAPKQLPNPPFVTLTAISNGEPAAKSSVMVHLMAPSR